MNECCFICNTKTGLYLVNATNLFGDGISLNSDKKLHEVIGSIVDKQIKKDGIHSHIICKKCQKAVVEYDSLQVRVQAIKLELKEQFKKTLTKYAINYETYNDEAKKTEKKEIKKLVLPASKLQPLPPDFLIKNAKWPVSRTITMPQLKTSMTLPSSSTLNLKVTVGSSVLTQSINTNTVANKKTITIPTQIDPNVIINVSQNDKTTQNKAPTKSDEISKISSSSSVGQTISTSSSITSNPILSFNVNTLPNIFPSAVWKKVDVEFDKKLKKEVVEGMDPESNEEQPVEIDSECNLSMLTSDNTDSCIKDQLIFQEDIKCDSESADSFVDVRMVGFDRDEHTLLMDRQNGSILRVVSGQKLLYGDNEISLVLPHDDPEGSQDSNSESQIELQVSGDEETANAIIAAARERGGAFIKVESGEMYRVKSVQSEDVENNSQVVLFENGSFKCLLCKDDASDYALAINKQTHTCLYCTPRLSSEWMSPSSACDHLMTSHSTQLFLCGECGEAADSRHEHTLHMEQHTNKSKNDQEDKKVYSCNVCNKRYATRGLLVEHRNTHSGAKPYVCRTCGKGFASKYTHQSHLKTHQARPRPFKCSQCGKSFFTLQNLNQHEKTHSGVKDFICNICGKAFGTQHNLEVHGVVHSGNKPFVCGVCGKAFARRAEVRDHMRIHTGERPFACEICGARFTQRSNLHSHRRATHLDDKRYACQHCSKRFKRRRLLDYHVKAAHTGERPLKCEVCRATFVYPEHYKKHTRIHSGERPYSCEVCGKTFNSRDNRNTHRFVHSDRKPYECVVCGAGYMRKQLLYQHMNTSGHLAESIVVNQPRVTSVVDVTPASEDSAKADKFPDTIYETTEELELDTSKAVVTTQGETKFFFTDNKKLILEDGKTMDLVNDTAGSALLTLLLWSAAGPRGTPRRYQWMGCHQPVTAVSAADSVYSS
ncbi:zinc finger protein 845 [Danaus plexippus plexippus]|uniref:Zinc finger protein 845 n=1 Tax=Danaus plexippus plexippus TaxID=278856 RepID=A0A212EHH5_DANPL|nr:zinc finger protein 845 [Danaus plexippus plexippus]